MYFLASVSASVCILIPSEMDDNSSNLNHWEFVAGLLLCIVRLNLSFTHFCLSAHDWDKTKHDFGWIFFL